MATPCLGCPLTLFLRQGMRGFSHEVGALYICKRLFRYAKGPSRLPFGLMDEQREHRVGCHGPHQLGIYRQSPGV